ncbi:hypothetical protein ACFL5I_00685 [Planctomycetota bacterium]
MDILVLVLLIGLIKEKGTFSKAKKCLDNDNIPAYSEDCDFCQYQQLATEVGRKKELTK